MNPPRLLSIVIPVYNERELVPQLLSRVEAVSLPGELAKEIILVDDCSTDGTREWLRSLEPLRPDLRITLHDTNREKGPPCGRGFASPRGT